MTPESLAVRNAFLPRRVPAVPGFDLAGGTATSRQGAGDTLWDHFTLSGGQPGFVVLRASQGPLPAGFYLGLGRTLFKGLAPEHDTVDGLMAAVNRTLTLGAPEAGEQILECGVTVPRDGQVEWASAGNAPGGVIGRDGTFQAFASQGPPMGVMDGFQYRTATYRMAVGDAMVVLSQGSSGLLKGAADLAAELVGKPVGEVVSILHKAIRQAQGDDSEVSVLFLRRG